MKLNYKRTVMVGFAFFLICSFWQAYDNTIPLILTNKFGMSQTWSGVIMALDNVLALFLLPLSATSPTSVPAATAAGRPSSSSAPSSPRWRWSACPSWTAPS